MEMNKGVPPPMMNIPAPPYPGPPAPVYTGEFGHWTFFLFYCNVVLISWIIPAILAHVVGVCV